MIPSRTTAATPSPARKLPAYGRALVEMRKRGQVPQRGFFLAHVVVVVDNWRLGRSFCRLVIAPEDKPESLDFVGVAGLDVFLVYDSCRSAQERIEVAIQSILAGQPHDLVVFDIQKSHAPKIIRAPNLGIERAGLRG